MKPRDVCAAIDRFPKVFGRVLDPGCYGRAGADVEGRGEDLLARGERYELGVGGFEGRGVVVCEGEEGAAAGEEARGGEADAGGGAGEGY